MGGGWWNYQTAFEKGLARALEETSSRALDQFEGFRTYQPKKIWQDLWYNFNLVVQGSYENLYIAASNKVETQLAKLNVRQYRYLKRPGPNTIATKAAKKGKALPKFTYVYEQAALRKKAKKILKRKKGSAGKSDKAKEARLFKLKTQLEVFKTQPPATSKQTLPQKSRVPKRGLTKVPFTRNIKRIGTN